jgi:hypothetical protein
MEQYKYLYIDNKHQESGQYIILPATWVKIKWQHSKTGSTDYINYHYITKKKLGIQCYCISRWEERLQRRTSNELIQWNETENQDKYACNSKKYICGIKELFNNTNTKLAFKTINTIENILSIYTPPQIKSYNLFEMWD